MSGRSHYLKSDHPLLGRYAKRRGPRTPAHQLPFWVLTFMLPDHMAFFAVAPGHLTTGVQISALRQVTVTGKLKPWVEQQAIAAVRMICPGWNVPIPARLTRAAEVGPSASGPLRPAIDRAIALRFDGYEASIVEGNAMRRVSRW